MQQSYFESFFMWTNYSLYKLL